MTLIVEPLRDLSEPEPDAIGDLAFVQTRIELDEQQRGDAITATIVLANTGGRPVELLNPFDLLQWQPLDGAAAPLDVPTAPPNLMVHRPASEPWKLRTGVPVVEVLLAGEPTDAAALDSPTLQLESEIELAATFAFAEIVEDGSRVQIPSGEYSLGCLATLIDSEQHSRIVGCRPLSLRFEKA